MIRLILYNLLIVVLNLTIQYLQIRYSIRYHVNFDGSRLITRFITSHVYEVTKFPVRQGNEVTKLVRLIIFNFNEKPKEQKRKKPPFPQFAYAKTFRLEEREWLDLGQHHVGPIGPITDADINTRRLLGFTFLAINKGPQ